MPLAACGAAVPGRGGRDGRSTLPRKRRRAVAYLMLEIACLKEFDR